VLTAHDVLPRAPRRFQVAAQRRLYARVDAVIAHTRHSLGRLEALGVAREKLHLIPHGAFSHLRGVRRKPGGLQAPLYNLVMGPPLLAPGSLALIGVLGLIAPLVPRER